MAFPWGRTRNGLLIGLQAIGPYLEDRTSITFAALLERAFGGFVPNTSHLRDFYPHNAERKPITVSLRMSLVCLAHVLK